MWPIVLLAVLAALVVMERAFGLWSLTACWRELRASLNGYLAQGDWHGAEKLFREASRRRPIAALFSQILTHRSARSGPPRNREERTSEALLRLRPHFFRRVSFLGITAAVAPLLGLLGTVTGMIGTFRAITHRGSGDPQLLSDGISQALITTQLGLAVAIPALLCNAALHSWARSTFADIEEHSVALLHRLEDALAPHSLVDDSDPHRTLERRHHG